VLDDGRNRMVWYAIPCLIPLTIITLAEIEIATVSMRMIRGDTKHHSFSTLLVMNPFGG
jgi:hypothetical protein